MRYNLFKQSLKASMAVCAFALLSACTVLDEDPAQIDEPIQNVQPQFQVQPTAAGICSAENEAACYVSYEEPDKTLAQAYAPYASMAVATNASYVTPVTLTAPATQAGLSVKDKVAQREQQRLLQQQQDLALQPVSSADIVCNGGSCDQQLFKTEIEKVIQTTITEEDGTSYAEIAYAQLQGQDQNVATAPAQTTASQESAEISLNERIAYGEEVHDWIAPQGSTMKKLLQQWGNASGWTVVWKLDRDYNLEAGVVFRGKFTEVAAAFIRSFARATPAPIGTFYKGNRVLVINAQENENAD